MLKYTIHYQRKVQVRPYEMLEIGLTEEFNAEFRGHDKMLKRIRDQVDKWIETEKERL